MISHIRWPEFVADLKLRGLHRWTAVLLATLALAAVSSSFIAGGLGAVAVATVSVALLFVVASLLADRRDIAIVAGGVVVVLLVRVALTSLLHLYLQERNPGGAMFQDDLGYVTMAALIARIWHGEGVPFPVDPSIVNSYVKSASGLFWIVGPNVVALKIANTALAVAGTLLAYRTTWIIGGRRPALIALAALLIWPSIGLWSALTLKEAFSFLSTMGIAWGVTAMVRSRKVLWAVPVVLFAIPLQDTRGYLFTLLIGLWPIALGLTWLYKRTPPLYQVALSAALAFVLIANIRPGLNVGADTFANLDQTREAMAEGAGSAIIESTRLVAAKDGECFMVQLVGGPGRLGDGPVTHVVPAGATLVYADRNTTDIRPPADSVQVRPGDVVCVGYIPVPVAATTQRPGGTPQPTPTPLPQLVLSSSGSTRVAEADSPATLRTVQENPILVNLEYLPRGALFLVGAPFPWDLVRPDRIIAAPEMLIWYPAVLAGFIGLAVLWRRRSFVALYVVLAGLGLAGILSLAEGNLGTLVRHRSMLVPYVVMVGACGVLPIAQFIRKRFSRS